MFNLLKKIFNNSRKKEINPEIGKTTDYIINDPNAPIRENITTPSLPNPCPLFVISGSPDDAKNIQVYTTLALALTFVQKSLIAPLHRWSSTNSLSIYTRAGEQFNAYYDRTNLKFFYGKVGPSDIVYTCESPDIVVHELGHAILDAIRPDLWSVQALECAAFHESFGDIMAIMHALHNPKVIQSVIDATKGNIKQSNFVSRLAEQMGVAIHKITGGRSGMVDALRNAVNSYKYVEPEKLPYNAGNDTVLCGECHSFSKVFTGAWYDLLANIYMHLLGKGMAQYDALGVAKDIITNITLKSLPLASLNPKFYASMAKAMMATSRSYYPEYVSIVKSSFVNRDIISHDITMLSNKNISELPFDSDNIWSFNNGSVIRKAYIQKVKFGQICGASTLSHTNIQDIEIEIAGEEYIEFDKHGNMIDMLSLNKQDSYNSAVHYFNHLMHNNEIEFATKIDNAQTYTKTFIVVDNKLSRLYFN